MMILDFVARKFASTLKFKLKEHASLDADLIFRNFKTILMGTYLPNKLNYAK